jgi:hypothetical protein
MSPNRLGRARRKRACRVPRRRRPQAAQPRAARRLSGSAEGSGRAAVSLAPPLGLGFPAARRAAAPRCGPSARRERAFTKPMSFAYSRKHWRHMFSSYLRMRPLELEHTRLRGDHAPAGPPRQLRRHADGARRIARAALQRKAAWRVRSAVSRPQHSTLDTSPRRAAACRTPRTRCGRPCCARCCGSSTPRRTPWLREERDDKRAHPMIHPELRQH